MSGQGFDSPRLHNSIQEKTPKVERHIWSLFLAKGKAVLESGLNLRGLLCKMISLKKQLLAFSVLFLSNESLRVFFLLLDREAAQRLHTAYGTGICRTDSRWAPSPVEIVHRFLGRGEGYPFRKAHPCVLPLFRAGNRDGLDAGNRCWLGCSGVDRWKYGFSFLGGNRRIRCDGRARNKRIVDIDGFRVFQHHLGCQPVHRCSSNREP